MSSTSNMSTTTSVSNITCYDIIATITTSPLSQASQTQSPSSASPVSSSAILIVMDCVSTGPPACSPTSGSFEHHQHHLHLTIMFSSTMPISIVTCYLLHSQHLYISLQCHHHAFISVESQTLKCLTNMSLFTTTDKSRVETFIEILQ